jgi:hypothetical protein
MEGGSPGYLKMFYNIPDFYPVNVHNILTLVITKNISIHCQISLGHKITSTLLLRKPPFYTDMRRSWRTTWNDIEICTLIIKNKADALVSIFTLPFNNL